MPPKKELDGDYDDAALARALQEEYEREYRRRGMQQHLRRNSHTQRAEEPRPSWSPTPPPPRAAAAAAAPPYNFPPQPHLYPSAPPASQVFEHNQPSSSFFSNNNNTGFFAEIEIGDEDDASFGPIRPAAPLAPPPRRPSSSARASSLEPTVAAIPPKKKKSSSSNHQRDVPYGSSAYPVHRGDGASPRNSNSRPPISEFTLVRAKTRYTTATPEQAPPLAGLSASALTGFEMSEDELLARRLEQELRDEEYARQMVEQEQVRRHHPTTHDLVTARHNGGLVTTVATARPCCGIGWAFRKCVCFIVSLVLMAIAVVLVLYLLGYTDNVSGFIPTPEDFRGEDPYNNSNPDDANLWRTDGAGLRLTIINALDENWHANFETAVSQWDNGTPDALALSTELSQPDSVCRAINGRVKVCNGNYGATNWRGINKVLLDENNRIYSSAARMNDFYVKDSDTAQKQYTMCHEIGHAFGLPHTDEDFYNKDLKNCMDYTSRPENNKQPAAPNFEFLTTLYGSIDGTIPRGTGTPSVQSAQDVEPDEDDDDDDDKKGKNKDDRRRDRRSLTRKVLPPEVELALDEIDVLADSGLIGSTSQHKGWRLLHASEHGQAHEIDLGDGYVVQLHMLGVAPQ